MANKDQRARTPKLRISRESLRKLTDDDLARVGGGFIIQRCTYEKSGCYG
jgi:hypothetical protein